MPIRFSPSLVSAAKAFADANRVRILAALRSGELCVCELCDALGLSQSTLSTHLKVIRTAGLVDSRKEGKWSYYALTSLGERLTKALFGCFPGSMTQEGRLKEDQRLLKGRLKLRQAGACCVGFGCSGKATGKGKGK